MRLKERVEMYHEGQKSDYELLNKRFWELNYKLKAIEEHLKINVYKRPEQYVVEDLSR